MSNGGSASRLGELDALAPGLASGASSNAPPAASASRRDQDVGANTSLPSIATISPSTVPSWLTSPQQPLLALVSCRALASATCAAWLLVEGSLRSFAASRN